jgi:hypothetical protein
VIEIGGAAQAVDPGLLRAPGGFVWWYADVVTPQGDGAVLIWSYGLPFLPGYADASRRGRPQLPISRPSVNLVVYRRGVPAFYLLQEHAPAPVDEGALTEVQRIGGCTFRRQVVDGRCTLSAVLDCELPGTADRLCGTWTLTGAARRDAGARVAASEHVWTPLTGPCEAVVDLSVGGRPLGVIRGRGYHDRNGGRVPLHDLGIGRWMWGRFPFAGQERIYYLLWPRAAGAEMIAAGVAIGADGRTEQVPLRVELGRERMTFGGLRRPERIVLRHGGDVWLDVRHTVVSDAGPFYLRLLSEGSVGGETVAGWSELVHPDRVDLARHRPFVRMRVHQPSGTNSPWLPLFTGPRAGRPARLVRHMLGLG